MCRNSACVMQSDPRLTTLDFDHFKLNGESVCLLNIVSVLAVWHLSITSCVMKTGLLLIGTVRATCSHMDACMQ